jgi:hypothetical protein
MAGANAASGRGEPLLWVTGAVVGVLLAVGLLVFTNFGSTGSAGASASASALPGQSVAPSLVAGASALPTDGASAAPPSDAPTEAPTPKPTKTPKPTPTPNTDPVIVVWETPKQEDCTGASAGSIHVRWQVRRADGVSVSIDGPGIYDSYAGLTGEIDLPYGCSNAVLEHTYTLRTVGGTGPADVLTRTVKTRAPSVVSFVMGEPDCGPGDLSVGISMSYEIRAATGAQLWYDDAPFGTYLLYGTYFTKATDDIVQYMCDDPQVRWRLTTTGGYGDSASKSRTVNR